MKSKIPKDRTVIGFVCPYCGERLKVIHSQGKGHIVMKSKEFA